MASQLLESKNKSQINWSDQSDDAVIQEEKIPRRSESNLNLVSTPKSSHSRSRIHTAVAPRDSVIIPPPSDSPPPTRSMRTKESLNWKEIPEFNTLKQRKRLASVKISAEVNMSQDQDSEEEEGEEEEMEYFSNDPADEDYHPKVMYNDSFDSSFSKP